MISIGENRLAAVVEKLKNDWGLEDDSEVAQPHWETDDVDSLVQDILGAELPSPLNLPKGSEAVAYFSSSDYDAGWVFALRPKPFLEAGQ